MVRFAARRDRHAGAGPVKKELKQLIAKALVLGWRYDGRTKNGHPIFRHESNGRTYITSGTPSDGRAYKNALADMKRIGRE